MERGMTGNCHVPCGVGEKLEITSNAYLLLTLVKERKNMELLLQLFFYEVNFFEKSMEKSKGFGTYYRFLRSKINRI
jgi:hypothetical protein